MSNQKIVIIGGSSGMGLSSAILMKNLGYQVVIASRSIEKLQKAKETIGGDVETFVLDIRNEEETKAFFQDSAPFHHLVISAADFAVGPFLEMPLDKARKFFDSKFWGQYHAAKYGAQKIVKGGSITFFSGIASEKPIPNLAVASSINGAIESLTKALAFELSPIRVNAISPGTIHTPIWGNSLNVKEAGSKIPLQRVGESEDIAEAVRFLIECSYITGEILHIDGGSRLI